MNQQVIFALSLFIPGLGHALIKRWRLALAGFIVFALELASFFLFILPNFQLLFVQNPNGTTTIGMTEYVHDSILIMVSSALGIMLLVVYAFIHYGFARDARHTAKQLNEQGYAVSTYQKMKALSGELLPNIITLPQFILMFVFMLLPVLVSIMIAFTNYRSPVLPPAFLIEWTGLENFRAVVSNPTTSAVFSETLVWTLVWTFCASLLTIVLGTLLAVVANNKKIKGKKFFRTIYILPWAVPAFLTILIFQIFFSKVGVMNTVVIPFFTGNPYTVDGAIGFFLNASSAKVLVILIQAWLGFPYVFILVTGVLQTIPDDLYEASSIDGGNPITNFFDITLPLILISVAPVFITQFTFNFNNVTIIYLLGEATVKNVGSIYRPLDTIASLGFRLMLEAKYNEAAVFTLITSTVVGIVVLFTWIKTGAFKNEEVM